VGVGFIMPATLVLAPESGGERWVVRWYVGENEAQAPVRDVVHGVLVTLRVPAGWAGDKVTVEFVLEPGQHLAARVEDIPVNFGGRGGVLRVGPVRFGPVAAPPPAPRGGGLN
jgi:hypothetical protein